MKIKEPVSCSTRWRLKLAEHDCLIDYIPGRENLIVDAFSSIGRITTRSKNIFTFKAFEHLPMAVIKKIFC